MSGTEHHPDVSRKDERVPRVAGRACVVTIWGFVILGYIICYVVEQYYGYAMYYGMILFPVPAIIVTILFVIGTTISWLMMRHSEPQVFNE